MIDTISAAQAAYEAVTKLHSLAETLAAATGSAGE